MDETEKLVAAARARGYSDPEIQARLAQQGIQWAPSAPAVPGMSVTQPGRDATMSPTPQDATTAAPGGAGMLAALGAGTAGGVYGAYRGVKAFAGGRATAAGADMIQKAVTAAGGRDALLERVKAYEAAGRGGLLNVSDLDPNLTAVSDFAATAKPEIHGLLGKLNEERRQGVPQRLLGDLQQLSPAGYQSPEYLTGLSKQSQADFAAGPTGYQGLREANPALSPKANKRMVTFLTSPKLQRAWSDAASVGAIGPLPKAGPTSFETLQNLKERLDGLTSSAFGKGDGDLGRRLAAARDDLTGLLTDEVPGYKEVAATYRDFAKHQDAVQAGVEAWSNHSLQLPDLARRLEAMTPVERAAFQNGLVGGYIRDIENVKTNRNLANELVARSATTGRKLELVFGSEKAFTEAVARYGMEASMSRLGGVVGGSITARRGARMADVAEGALDVAHVASHPMTGVPSLAKKWYTKWLPGKTAEAVRPLVEAQGADAIARILRRLPK